MADTLQPLRSLLARPVGIDEALMPYLGASPFEAAMQADADRTSEGLLTGRLRDLVTILALREAPSSHAMLTAALLWRSAPVAFDVEELREAIVRISLWRGALDDAAVARIALAHHVYDHAIEDVIARTGTEVGPEVEVLRHELEMSAAGDSVVVELGDALLIVQMTATRMFVGIEDEAGGIHIVDSVPMDRRGRDDDQGDAPDGPRPLLLDA
jgi:hypothetical protein